MEPRWFRDGFGNARLVMPAGRHRLLWKGLATASGRPDPVHPDAVQHPVEDLPDEVLPFLQPSRHVGSDLLSQDPWDRFGHIGRGWDKVQAVCDLAHERPRFDHATASPLRAAHSSLAEGHGVCRDSAHLVIGMARALNIPARYASGFLGDIGWPDMGPATSAPGARSTSAAAGTRSTRATTCRASGGSPWCGGATRATCP